MEKWPFFDQNHGLIPLEKSQFFEFLNSFFYGLESLFFVLDYCKTNFRGLYCLKKRHGKMAIFWPKPWVNPFGKISIFGLFKLFFLYRLEKRFFVLEYCKTHFRGLYCLKRRHGKMAIFWPKPWVNPFGKISIFRLFEVLVFIG